MNSDLLEKQTKKVIEEQRFTLSGVTWQEYEILRATMDNYPGLRMTYLKGTLELFMPSPEHETSKTTIARLIELYSLEKNIRLYGCGSTTYRKKAKERGLEPDESYCIGRVKEFPDLAIEVIMTSGTIDKLEVYSGLGVPEVWFWQNEQFRLYSLQDGKYEEVTRSKFLPDLDLDLLATYIKMPDQYDAIVEFRNAIQEK